MRPFIILALALAACDETAEGVRRNYVDRHSDAFLYQGTTHDYVLHALRGVMDDQGMDVVATEDPLMFKAVSRAAAAPNRRHDEYAVHIVDLRWRKGFMVQLVKITREPDGSVYTSYRDDQLEWELIQRADPDRAAEIMAKANDQADKVRPRHHGN